MDLKILPNELYILERGALIQTRCPKDLITEQMIHQRVVAANLSAGDTLKIQCVNHDRTTILSFAEFLVYDRSEEIRRVEVSDYETKSGAIAKYSVLKIQDWQDTPAGRNAGIVTGNVISTSPELKWNPGTKTHQAIVNGNVVYEDPDKQKVIDFISQKKAA